MKNVTKPRAAVSFEDALRNLAAKLTGAPVHELPRSQEGIVQFMTDNVPSVDEMAEAITQEVISRLTQVAPSEEDPEKPEETEPPAVDGGSAETPPDIEQGDPVTTETPEEPAEAPKPKSRAKRSKSKSE